MMKTAVLTSVLMGFTAAFLGMTGQVLAQGTGLTISPVNFELTANPGEVVANTLRVYNPTNSTIQVRMTVEDFAVAGETGQVVVEPAETETYSLASWVTPIPDSFTLEPNERQVVEFVIEVPRNAEPGGHYGSVLASTAGVIGAEGFTGAAVAQKVGALVLLNVSGEVTENLQVVEFDAPEFLEFGPIPFLIRFENRGTVHVRPRGFVTITNWRDKKVIDLEFPQKNVLPNSIRRIETSWDTKWLFGKYTATVIGSYGTSNIPLSPWIVSFWVVPWKVLVAAAGGTFLVFGFFFFTRRRWMGAVKILLKGDRKR